jgi:hypothetical protein
MDELSVGQVLNAVDSALKAVGPDARSSAQS